MSKKPKILFYDIETRPNLAYVWGKYEQDVIAFKEEWELLSFAYKWSGDRKVTCITREGQKSDRELVTKLHKLFQVADILVAHNGDQFDQKKAKARMIFHKLPPTKILTTIDTLKVAKTYFNFNGNRLNDLAQHLGLGKKLPNEGFDLWIGCMAGDSKSWAKMERYNKRDVVLLEKVYEKFKPWVQNHPNISRLMNPLETRKAICPQCASTNVKKEGYRANRSSSQRQWSCKECKSWFLTALSVGQEAKR